jgi:hypothetical protein
LKCVVKGSEKDDEGIDTNGGGNGRDGRLGLRAYPVSKQKTVLDRDDSTFSGLGVFDPNVAVWN